MPAPLKPVRRAFSTLTCIGLREIPKPESLRVRGGVWFDAGGLDVHVSVELNTVLDAQNRASFRSGQIRVLDSTGKLEKAISFDEVQRKL